MMTTCDDARALVPSYLDGELSEAQASPLRAHLLDCRACREVAKEGKALQRWFAFEPAAVPVPAGFAARVARRALAGDPGLLVPEPPAVRTRGTLLPFLLLATAVAAALLLVLAVAIRNESLPRSNRLDAQEGPPWLTRGAARVESTLDRSALDRAQDAPTLTVEPVGQR
jgi:anti-sigma factor RsiW